MEDDIKTGTQLTQPEESKVLDEQRAQQVWTLATATAIPKVLGESSL